MLSNRSEQVRECLQHADDCGRQAAAQADPRMKADFLDLERRWLSLARSRAAMAGERNPEKLTKIGTGGRES